MRTRNITLPKEVFTKILTDAETLLNIIWFLAIDKHDDAYKKFRKRIISLKAKNI